MQGSVDSARGQHPQSQGAVPDSGLNFADAGSILEAQQRPFAGGIPHGGGDTHQDDFSLPIQGDGPSDGGVSITGSWAGNPELYHRQGRQLQPSADGFDLDDRFAGTGITVLKCQLQPTFALPWMKLHHKTKSVPFPKKWFFGEWCGKGIKA